MNFFLTRTARGTISDKPFIEYLVFSFIFLAFSFTAIGQCNDLIYDSGGAASNYADNENIITTYSAPSNSQLKLVFEEFSIENGYDFLYVYDGESTSAQLLQTLTGSTLPGDILATGNKITLKFVSDYSVNDSGYKIKLECSTASEICDNGLDDDDDGLFDCADSDCSDCIAVGCGAGVKLMSYKSATASGSGASGVPIIPNFVVPEGNKRMIFIAATFEREHCQDGDDCSDNNTSGTGLSDNFADNQFVGNNAEDLQILISASGQGGSLSKTNALVFPQGDLGYVAQYGYPSPPDPNINAAYFSREMYFFSFNESEINSLLGGEASGNLTISLPDISLPKDVADDAILTAYTFSNVKQEADGIVKSNLKTTVQELSWTSVGFNGDYSISNSWDSGQVPNEETDGVLVLGLNGVEGYGFEQISGFSKIEDVIVNNGIQSQFTALNESDGITLSSQFRNGPTNGELSDLTIKSTAPNSLKINGGIMVAFTIESCEETEEICNNGLDDDNDGAIDENDLECATCSNSMLINSGFDSGLENWVNDGNAFQGAESNGNEIAIVSGGSGGLHQIVDVYAGSTVNVSFFGLASGNSFEVGISFLDASDNAIGSSISTNVSSQTVKKYNLQGIAPENTAKVKVYVLKTDETNVAYVDAFCMSGGGEICDNGVDDDGDGDIDCADLDCGKIYNREFDGGESGWDFYSFEGYSSTYSIDNSSQLSGQNSAFISITEIASESAFQIQFYQSGISFEVGKSYLITFDAKATSSRTLATSITSFADGETLVSQGHNLTSETQTFSYYYTALRNDPNCRIVFGLGASLEDVYIDNVQIKEECTVCEANAGPDISKCNNAFFDVTANTPKGASGVWSIVSGNATPTKQLFIPNNTFIVEPGESATLRWTVTNGTTCTVYDDVTISNNINCNFECTNPINLNGNLEEEGTATNFDLNFHGLPALLIEGDINPVGWEERYGGIVPNAADFNGAYYVVMDNAHSPDHAIYVKGNNYCLSFANTSTNLECGKTYRYSVWVAAYSHNVEQDNAPFALEFKANGDNPLSTYKVVGAPASNGLNDLKWIRFELQITLDSDEYDNADFYFTSFSSEHGFFVDDACLEEVFGGAEANAGVDQFECNNIFNIEANAATGAYSGSWEVLEGDVTISNLSAPSTTATINQGVTAKLRWNVSDGECSSYDDIELKIFEPDDLITVDKQICPGEDVVISVEGCNSDVLWSNGETTSSITVSPDTTTTYYVRCSPDISENILSNGNFENDLTGWTVNANSSSTSDQSNVQEGSKAAFIDATSAWAGMEKSISATPGVLYNVSFYAKASNINRLPYCQVSFRNNDGTVLKNEIFYIQSFNYKNYNASFLAPSTTTTTTMRIELVANSPGRLYVDNYTIREITSCEKEAAVLVEVTDTKFEGNAVLCIGEQTTVVSNVEGTWISSDENIASVSNTGIVIGHHAGMASISFKNAATGCITNVGSVTVLPEINVTIDVNGSQCFSANSKLSTIINGSTTTGYMYNWTGPNGFTATGDTISIPSHGNYTVNVSNSYGCTGQASIFIYEEYEPFIFSVNTSLCEDEDVTLSVNGQNSASYQWGENAGNSTAQNVTVVPEYPNTTYSVTVTNSIGCTVATSSTINVIAQPTIVNEGADELCIGGMTQLSSNSPGIWQSSNSTVASVNGTGLVTAHNPGVAIFRIKSSTTGCYSDSLEVVVGINANISILGENDLCAGGTSQLTASVPGGFWSTDAPSVATIDNNGLLTAVSLGTANITYTPNSSSSVCYMQATYAVVVNSVPNVILNGQQKICEGELTNVSANMDGLWSSSDTTIATVSNAGVVNGLSQGNVLITFTSNAGCSKTLNTPITVIGKANISFNGNNSMCVGETSSLTSDKAGTWISNNSSIVKVSNDGIIEAMGQGIAEITFVEFENGCLSDAFIVSVYTPPLVSLPQEDELCIGDMTSINANSNQGTWVSADTTIARIDESGQIVAVSPGTVNFTFIDEISGCSTLSEPVIVYPQPIVEITGPTTICRGETTNLTPNSDGFWSSSDVSVAIISNSGEVTAVGPGKVVFTYTQASVGCSSLPSDTLIVDDPAMTSLVGPNQICIGASTNFTPNSGGYWTSLNPDIATINSEGVVLGLKVGTSKFIFHSDTGCDSDPTVLVSVVPGPEVSITGPSSICIGTGTTLSPTSGGVWTSSNENIAIVNNQGVVTAVSSGEVFMTFESDDEGCASTLQNPITVEVSPIISIVGSSEICLGDQTYLSPSTGGTWVTNDNSVATISNSGILTGIAEGTVTCTFIEAATGCSSKASQTIAIIQKPEISLQGSNTICIGETTNFEPMTGGTWISNNENVATIDSDGVVLGVSQGVAKFTFVSSSGCSSNESVPVIVYGKPTASLNGITDLCLGNTLQLQPSTGGTWQSSNNQVASVTPNGFVTPISSGVVQFIYTEINSGCSSDLSEPLSIHGNPTISLDGPDLICIGSTTILSSNTVGTWETTNPNIATIDENGLVTGMNLGTVQFIFTNSTTGCISDTSDVVTVSGGPSVLFTGQTELCVGETSSIGPATNGTWTSSNPLVAIIDNNGIISAISPGSVKFQYTETSSGCSSIWSPVLIVNNDPSVGVSGSPMICIGSTAELIPSTGGTWSSSDDAIATVTNEGIVTANATGTAYFTFTDNQTGCSSNGTLAIEVLSEIDVSIVGDTKICTGYTTILSPSSGGTWYSSNSAIATVSNSGIVTGRAPGSVTFTFVDENTGCSAGGTTDTIMVSNCINHDFNVALINQMITGNVSTNDNFDTTMTYGNTIINDSKPSASIPILTVNSDGTYSFVTNKSGKYMFRVSGCNEEVPIVCSSAILEITVLENVYGQSNPVANLEFVSTMANEDPTLPGQPVDIYASNNDACVYTGGCELDNNSYTIIDSPNGGTLTMTNGVMTYVPNPGFVGVDTLIYSICETGQLGINCNQSIQIITVMSPSAGNSIVAADDFTFTFQGQSITGNLSGNDMDPEGNTLTVQAQGTEASPIVTEAGSYFINDQGAYTFIANPDFEGATEIIYTICDDHVQQACTDATLHIQVFGDMRINIRVYLEAALVKNRNELSQDGKPLMRDDLRHNPYNGNNYIPKQDPYTIATSINDLTYSNFKKAGPGLMSVNQEIPDSAAVFLVTGDNAIVDWIWVELRHKDYNDSIVATRSGLLQRDGDVVDLDGKSGLKFQGVAMNEFYVVVKHRNHLGVMSGLVTSADIVDFTDPDTEVFNYGIHDNGIDYTGLSQKQVKGIYRALWAGDMNNDGKIKFAAPASDQNILYTDVLFQSPDYLINFDNAYGYYNGDYDMNGKAKYTNPDDDINLLFTQILLYPRNTSFVSNYGNLIEQVPPHR